MSDRNLVAYEESRNPDGPHWRLMIDRSAAGAPGLYFTIMFDSVDGTLPHQEMTIVVEDGAALLAPVNAWLERHQEPKAAFVVMGPDGLYGVYATEDLAQEHRARMSRPDEFDIERDLVRTELMPEVVE